MIDYKSCDELIELLNKGDLIALNILEDSNFNYFIMYI